MRQTESPVWSVREDDDRNCCRCRSREWGALFPIPEEGAGNGRSLAATRSVAAADCHGCHLRDPPWATVVGGSSRWEHSPGKGPWGSGGPAAAGAGAGGEGTGRQGAAICSLWRSRRRLSGPAEVPLGCHRAGSPGGAGGGTGAAPPPRVCAGRAAAAPLRQRSAAAGRARPEVARPSAAHFGPAQSSSPGSARVPPAGQIRPRPSGPPPLAGMCPARPPSPPPPALFPTKGVGGKESAFSLAVLPRALDRVNATSAAVAASIAVLPSFPPPSSTSPLKRANLRWNGTAAPAPA